MTEAKDDNEKSSTDRFDFRPPEEDEIASIIVLVRSWLDSMDARHLSADGHLLLALERLPQYTPGVVVRLGVKKWGGGGNYAWADVQFSDEEFRLSSGEHFYDPDVGGDTESKEHFVINLSGFRLGSIGDWLVVVKKMGSTGFTSEDLSGEGDIDWFELENSGNEWG